MTKLRSENGDTLVEVLLATVIISVVLTAAFALTNRATRLNQTAIERTTAANLMREQIEIIRSARTGGTQIWTDVLANTSSSNPDYSQPLVCQSTTGVQPFYVALGANPGDPPTLQTISSGNLLQDANPGDFYSVWAEAYERVDANSRRYVDVHVRTCWEGIGGESVQRSAIVLRLSV